MSVGNVHERVREARQADAIIGQYGEGTKSANIMLMFLENTETETLNDKALEPDAQWA